MSRLPRFVPLLAVLALTAVHVPSPAHAQQPPDNNGGGPGGGGPPDFGGGGGGPPDPAQMQQRMIRNLRRQMGLNSADFSSLQPDIQKIMQLRQALDSTGRPGRGPGEGGPGGGGPGGGNGPADMNGGGPGGFGGGGPGGGGDNGNGGPGGPPNDPTANADPNNGGTDSASAQVATVPAAAELTEKVRTLRASVRPTSQDDGGNATGDAELADQVAAVRSARAKAEDELAKTRKDLKTLVKPGRQEAVLVAAGILD